MIINLKQINLSDSDNIKLDKINYNFDQLVANGGGPMGSTGPMGNQGATGITGAQGYQGPIGTQGFQGDPGANTTAYWKNIAGGGAVPVDTILPIHDPLNSAHPPVVSVGFISTDPEYGTGQNTSQGQLPYQWAINRRSNFIDNLRFTSSDVIGNYFRFRLENDVANSINKFTMGFSSISQTSIIWHAQNHIFIDNTTGNILLEISDTNIVYHKDVEYDRPVTINGLLKIGNANADVDKIAVAGDVDGTVVFKSIDELGGTVPYGTIVSILPSVFSDNNNFVNSEQVTLPNIDDVLKISVGKGINDYAGWYICNGKTWIGDANQSQHLIPDLNSFSYNIQDNLASISPTGQGTAQQLNDETSLIGGANIGMTAVNVFTGIYNISSTVDTVDTTVSSATGTTFKIKKLPQIIYLGETDLYWQDAGSGQAPVTTVNFQLVDANVGGNSLGTVALGSASNTQGGSYFHQVYVTAPSGYYWSSMPALTFPSYIDGIIVTPSPGTYPLTLALNISVDIQPANGTTVTIGIDTTSLLTAIPMSTQIYPTQVSYPSIDAISNGYVYQVYDLGTDPNSAGTLIPSGSVTAQTGSIRYIKYRLKAGDYFYKWTSPSLSSFSFNNVAGIGAGQITEHSVTDVNGDGKTIDYIIKDNNFGVGNPGGSNQLFAYINSNASIYTDVMNETGNGSPSASFNFNGSGSSSPISINAFAIIRVRSGVSALLRLKASSNTYISGGNASASIGGNSLSATFPYMTTTQAVAYSSGTVVPNDGTTVTVSGSANINTGAGGTFGSASISLEYSTDGGSTWSACGS